jgi:adenylate cyclase
MRENRAGGRRLAAILAADVAGYSRLIRADEEGTIARLRTLRRELIDPAIDAYAGRIIKTTGDGLLIEFASVVDAVRCAVSVQRGMVSQNEDVPEDRPIVFRVGINLGDVVIERDGDLMGDGINVASRLEGLAEPGGICLSGAAYEQVRDKLELPFADSGEQTVKNIDRPVRIYVLSAAAIWALPGQPTISGPKPFWSRASHSLRLVTLGAGALAVAAAGVWFEIPRSMPPTATTAPPLSIVVLPFANLSGDPQQEYFADAITEDVTTDLSRIRGSFVIAHNTAQTFKGKPVDMRQVAKELGVRYVLAGSVQRDGSVVRATVQFINASSGQQLWADRFDTDVTDIFKLQNQISARIANSLRLEMVSAAGRVASTHGVNVDAQDYVMQAKAFFESNPTSRDSYREVQQLYERALAIDDKSADAWAGLARTLAGGQAVFPDENRARDLERAEAAAERAIALDPDNAEAHDASGLVQRQLQNFEKAEVELERAIALDRNFALPYFELGNVEVFLGKPDKALPLFEQAERLSPHDSRLAFFLAAIGWCHLLLGDDKAGIEWGLKARSVNPTYTWANLLLADAYAHLGDEKEARAALATALRSNPHLSIRVLQQVGGSEPAWVKLADERFYDGLRKAGLPEQ